MLKPVKQKTASKMFEWVMNTSSTLATRVGIMANADVNAKANCLKLLVCVGKILPRQKHFSFFFLKKLNLTSFFTTFKITKPAVVNSVSRVITA